jgi:transcriptional regulator with XRE-family HTH domain
MTDDPLPTMVRLWMAASGVTGKALAQAIGVPPADLSRFLHGRPDGRYVRERVIQWIEIFGKPA